ncbi:unnamed protein product, partial [Protopolystoma xenopodis]
IFTHRSSSPSFSFTSLLPVHRLILLGGVNGLLHTLVDRFGILPDLRIFNHLLLLLPLHWTDLQTNPDKPGSKANEVHDDAFHGPLPSSDSFKMVDFESWEAVFLHIVSRVWRLRPDIHMYNLLILRRIRLNENAVDLLEEALKLGILPNQEFFF